MASNILSESKRVIMFAIAKFVKILLITTTLFISQINIAYSEPSKTSESDIGDDIESVKELLKNITCETGGIGNMFYKEGSHTCAPSATPSPYIASFISPGMYQFLLLRLRINDNKVKLDNGAPFNSQCHFSKHTDYENPKISFGICSNFLLAKEKAKSSLKIAKELVTLIAQKKSGEALYKSLEEVWHPDPNDFTEKFISKKIGESGVFFDGTSIFPWEIVRDRDMVCVSTKTLWWGSINAGCIFVKEPYPYSIYSKFKADEDELEEYNEKNYLKNLDLVDCTGTRSCYARAKANSKNLMQISLPLIECINQMITRLLVDKRVCNHQDSYKFPLSYKDSSFFKFNNAMKKTVTGFLTIYIILFGFKIILKGDVPPKSELIMVIIHFLLVVYFTIGINFKNNNYNGMISFAFPLMFEGASTLASWVMDATSSGLCKFNKELYDEGYKSLSLWDSLDCRISHYLGLDFLTDFKQEKLVRLQQLKEGNINQLFSASYPPYFILVIAAFLSTNLSLVILTLSYPLIVISVAAYMVNAFIICMISIAILGTLAPIFIPFSLFSVTKGYFQSWLKLLISFVLQPMVVASFMMTMFAIYDLGFYDSCKYKAYAIDEKLEENSLNLISRPFKSNTTSKLDKNSKLQFLIDTNRKSTKYTNAEYKRCTNSLGYMLNNPLNSIIATHIEKGKKDFDDLKNKAEEHSIQNAIMSYPGIFIKNSISVPIEKIKDFTLALITAIIILYMIYHFSTQLSKFAADMVEGVAIDGMAIKPQSVYQATKQAAEAVDKVKNAAVKLVVRAAADYFTAGSAEAVFEAADVAAAAANEAKEAAKDAVSNVNESVQKSVEQNSGKDSKNSDKDTEDKAQIKFKEADKKQNSNNEVQDNISKNTDNNKGNNS